MIILKIYECLLGEWVCLNDDPNATIGNNGQSPITCYKENGEIWAPFKRNDEHIYTQLDYVHIFYKGTDYRINPISFKL